MRLRHAACAALLALSLTACGPRPVDHATLAAAQAAGAIDHGLLPDGLPPSTALIRIERDADRAAGYFHFSSGDYAVMAARFAPLAQLPADPALQTWVKRKDLAGYEAYTLAQGGRTWLLLCAQNKGRCYYRLLG
ncbi:MAG: hypothetical protein U5L03_02935 [Burkholderiaceae bacterium]|nr:hypothetical protein [Burkholderiaceae bacterium]